MAFLLIGYQNCSVDLASTTPGASLGPTGGSCEPTAQQITDFKTILQDILATSGTITGSAMPKCGTCHSESASNSAKNVFMVLEGTTDDVAKRNFCSIKARGRKAVDHPRSATHGGGQYQSSDIQPWINFFDSNF